MLGTVRFTLATLVVLNHLWLPTANKVGAHAVAAFYLVSGYLMTMIIQEVYGLTMPGAVRYVANRFLRIYPPYLFFLGFSVVLMTAFPGAVSYSTMTWPASAGDWLRNITLVDLVHSPSAIIPPAWSLGVEGFFYVAMVALLSRSEVTVALWLAASVAVHIYLVAAGASFSARYYPLHAASLFFSIGAATYFGRRRLARLTLKPLHAVALLPVFCFWPLVVEGLGGDRSMLGYYGAIPLFWLIFVACVAQAAPSSGPADRFLGDLAYPVYIVHFMAAMLLNIMWAGTRLTFGYLLTSYALTIGLSVAYITCIHTPLEQVRLRIRPQPAA
jgi:peptidoglycan/LPS O-acetylase OafA/YrhL